MIREITLNGETFPAKFGFSAFMHVKSDMSEAASICTITYHAIKIAAKRVNPSLLADERLKDVDAFADEIFFAALENANELEELTKAIEQAQTTKQTTKKKA